MVSLLQFVFLGLRLDGVTSWSWGVSIVSLFIFRDHNGFSTYPGSVYSFLACVHCIYNWRIYLHDNSNIV